MADSLTKYETAWEIIYNWWEALQKESGRRAGLSRIKSLEGIVLHPSYLNLFYTLQKADVPQGMKKSLSFQLPLVVGVLVHVRHNDQCVPVARAMGSGKSGAETSVVSDLRFRRILAIDSTTDSQQLHLTMIRVIRMLGNKVNIRDLAGSLFYWNGRTKKRWASLYYLKQDVYQYNQEDK